MSLGRMALRDIGGSDHPATANLQSVVGRADSFVRANRLKRSPLDRRHLVAVERSFPLTLTLSLGESTCLARQPRIRQERGIYPAGTPARQIRAWKFQDPVDDQPSCGLKSALVRSPSDYAKHIPRGRAELRAGRCGAPALPDQNPRERAGVRGTKM